MLRNQNRIKKDKLFYQLAEDYVCDLNQLLCPYFLDDKDIAQLKQDIQQLQEHFQAIGQQAISFQDRENKTVLTITATPEIKVHKGYRWDGCSPKWSWLDSFWLGTPDGVRLRERPIPTNFRGYHLEVKALSNAAELPASGQNRIFIANIDDRYHVRIFDAQGQIILNQVSGEFLPDQTLIQELGAVLNASSIDPKTANHLIDRITSLLRHARVRLVQDVPRKALGASALHDVLGYCKRDPKMPPLFREPEKEFRSFSFAWIASLFRADQRKLFCLSPDRVARDRLFLYLLKRRNFAPRRVYYITVSLLGPIFDLLFGFTNQPKGNSQSGS